MTRILRCTCCGLPVGRIDDGVLVIESNHHGRRHRSLIRLSEPLDKADYTVYTATSRRASVVRLLGETEE